MTDGGKGSFDIGWYRGNFVSPASRLPEDLAGSISLLPCYCTEVDDGVGGYKLLPDVPCPRHDVEGELRRLCRGAELVAEAWREFQDASRSNRLCGVCIGTSPTWDGHDKNPPCVNGACEELGNAIALLMKEDA